jgi:hypothetical protein
MIPLALLKLFGSKAGRTALLVLAVIAVVAALWFGFWAWVAHREAAAARAERVKVVAEYQAATDLESTRRVTVLETSRELGEAIVGRILEEQRGILDEHRRRITPLVSRNRDRSCLDRDSVLELRRLTGRPPGQRTGQPAGEPAGGAGGTVRGTSGATR